MLSDTALEKATRLYQTGQVTYNGDTFKVRGDHGTYQVRIDNNGSCNCPARGRCSHIEAVYLEIRFGELKRAVTRGRARTTEYVKQHQETTNGTI